MKDTCCILAAGGLWGMISVFIRTLQQAGFTSMQCVAIRAFFTALVLLLYVCAKDPLQPAHSPARHPAVCRHRHF